MVVVNLQQFPVRAQHLAGSGPKRDLGWHLGSSKVTSSIPIDSSGPGFHPWFSHHSLCQPNIVTGFCFCPATFPHSGICLQPEQLGQESDVALPAWKPLSGVYINHHKYTQEIFQMKHGGGGMWRGEPLLQLFNRYSQYLPQHSNLWGTVSPQKC